MAFHFNWLLKRLIGKCVVLLNLLKHFGLESSHCYISSLVIHIPSDHFEFSVVVLQIALENWPSSGHAFASGLINNSSNLDSGHVIDDWLIV